MQNTVNRLIAVAAANTPKVNFFVPKITANLTGVTAGECSGDGKTIRINKLLVEQEHLKHELYETIVHEVAHSVDIQRNGYRKDSRNRYIHHDAIFYRIMAELGITNAKRTHDIKDLKPTRKYREFEYRLSNGKIETLKTIRHNKLQRGKVEYYQWPGGARAYSRDFIREVK